MRRRFNVHDVILDFETDSQELTNQLLIDYEDFLVKHDVNIGIKNKLKFLCHESTIRDYQENHFLTNLGDICSIKDNCFKFMVTELNYRNPENVWLKSIRPYFTTAIVELQIQKFKTFFFHSGCVTINDKGIAFMGESGSGKTSLTSQCILNGADYLSHEIVFIKRKDDVVYMLGLPQRITLDIGAAVWFSRNYIDLNFGVDLKKYSGLNSESLFDKRTKTKITLLPNKLKRRNITNNPIKSKTLTCELKYIIFLEPNLNLKEPRAQIIGKEMAAIKLLKANESMCKWNYYWPSIDFNTYYKDLIDLIKHISNTIPCYHFQWCSDHKLNYDYLTKNVLEL